MSKSGGKAKSKEPEYDDKEQSKRFIDKAKELDSDESGKDFDRVMTTLAPHQNQQTDSEKD